MILYKIISNIKYFVYINLYKYEKIPLNFIISQFTYLAFGCKQGENNFKPTSETTGKVSSGGQENVVDATSNPNIVQTAAGSKDHTTLVTAVKAAGLVTSLSNAGPFTVFAPTNAAFDKLPAGTVEGLLKPEKKAI